MVNGSDYQAVLVVTISGESHLRGKGLIWAHSSKVESTTMTGASQQ